MIPEDKKQYLEVSEEPEAETLEEEALINEPEAESSPEDKEVDDVEIDDLTLPATRQEVLEAIKPIAENLNELNEAITSLKKDNERLNRRVKWLEENNRERSDASRIADQPSSSLKEVE